MLVVDKHACSIESFPKTCYGHLHCEPSLFLCGLYELNEDLGVRSGSILLCSSSSSDHASGSSIHSTKTSSPPLSSSPSSTPSLSVSNRSHHIHCISSTPCTSGVLDMKLSSHWLAVALSEGAVAIYDTHSIHEALNKDEEKDSYNGIDKTQNVTPKQEHTQLKEIGRHAKADEQLFLSVSWDTPSYSFLPPSPQSPPPPPPPILQSQQEINMSHDHPARLAVSTQASSILIYDVCTTSSSLNLSHSRSLEGTHTMQGQNMPAWIVEFDPHSKQRIISGGDDCQLKLWDLRLDCLRPTWSSRKCGQGHFDAGVTSAQWHPFNTHIFATGSYDESVRVWDDRYLKDPVAVTETGGGVWRIKWLCDKSTDCDYLVTACMHAGSKILRLHGDTTSSFSSELGLGLGLEVGLGLRAEDAPGTWSLSPLPQSSLQKTQSIKEPNKQVADNQDEVITRDGESEGERGGGGGGGEGGGEVGHNKADEECRNLLTYGIDVISISPENVVVASCSFYENRIDIESFDIL